MTFSLRRFTTAGHDPGRSRAVQATWFALENLVFRAWWCPARLRVHLLRSFGAVVGERVHIRHGVRVHFPWKLSMGDDVWLGVDVWLLDLEPITIGSNVCLSQQAFICTGSHDRRSPTFAYDNAPITIEDDVWIATRATVLRGVTIGRGSVVGAGAIVSRSLPAESRVSA